MARLSGYFIGVAAKRLSNVETDPKVSNQHEFQGIRAMVDIFGRVRKMDKCTFLYLGDDENETVASEGTLTWYDSRENQPHRSPEFRYYYTGNIVTELATKGDLLVIAQKPDNGILALVVKQGSTIERQVLWLFGITGESGRFVISKMEDLQDREIGFAERTILETIGVELEIEEKPDWLDLILKEFGELFPSTRIFSRFARNTLKDVSSLDDPDLALMEWINHEEMLFRTLEKHIVEQRINKGFKDVDDFICFSLSVHNRRKSRMGYALENHLEQVFIDYDILYSREKVTEAKSKPDFIFPSVEQYRDQNFPADLLTMLGAKSTCKDRWRQVLTEATRIDQKHLFTLEPGISENQTNEMKNQNLQLVLPAGLHETYLDDQKVWLINFSDFLDMVKIKQNNILF